LDLSFGKSLTYGRLHFSPKIDVFNVFNANPVLAEVITIGPSLGQPTSVLNPRLIRVGANIVF